MFGAHEEQTAAVARGDRAATSTFCSFSTVKARCSILGAASTGAEVNRRIRQMGGGQRLDTAVESGREEQSLAVGRDGLDDAM